VLGCRVITPMDRCARKEIPLKPAGRSLRSGRLRRREERGRVQTHRDSSGLSGAADKWWHT